MNPPGPDVSDSQIYLSLSPVDGRRFLEKDYALGNKSYYPVCTTNAPIVFENIKSYDIKNAGTESLVDYLSRACRAAKDSLNFWINQPGHFPATLSMSNFIAYMIAEYVSMSDGTAYANGNPQEHDSAYYNPDCAGRIEMS